MQTIWVDNFYNNNNYIAYEPNGERNKTPSIEEHLNQTTPYLNAIHNFKKSDTQKIQLTLAINFFSSRNTDKEV